jgi:hypothetical protein
MRGIVFGGERGILLYPSILLTYRPIRLYLLQTFATKALKYGQYYPQRQHLARPLSNPS